MKKKYIFLDFDGCCNSFAEGSYMTNGSETYGPSKTICDKLVKFCKSHGVKIIISSNWRKFEPDGHYTFDGNTVQNPLGKLKKMLGDCMVGTLPPTRHVSKSECLILWMEDQEKEFEFVIFDDDPREGFQSTYDYGIHNHFIMTNREFGITDEDLKKASIILNIETQKKEKVKK